MFEDTNSLDAAPLKAEKTDSKIISIISNQISEGVFSKMSWQPSGSVLFLNDVN